AQSSSTTVTLACRNDRRLVSIGLQVKTRGKFEFGQSMDFSASRFVGSLSTTNVTRTLRLAASTISSRTVSLLSPPGLNRYPATKIYRLAVRTISKITCRVDLGATLGIGGPVHTSSTLSNP